MRIHAGAYACARPPAMPTRPDPTRPDLILLFISPLRFKKCSYQNWFQIAREKSASMRLMQLDSTNAASRAVVSTLDANRRRDENPKPRLPRIKENHA